MNGQFMEIRVLGVLLAGVAAALAVGVLAPAAALAAERASNAVIEEVTVTARKREERVIDTPVAVAVLTQEEIERYNTRDLAQLTQRIPGVSIAHAAGGGAGGNMVIRGVGNIAVDYGADQPVSLVIDGMSFSRGHVLDTGFFDTASVEVLKGPQTLYFGKNSPAGVIGVTSVSPQLGAPMTGFARAQYEFIAEDPVVEAGLSFPLGDRLAMRLAGRFQDMKGGWLKNSAEPLDNAALYSRNLPSRGASMDKFPGQEQHVLRWTTVWQPTDSFAANLKLFYSKSEQNEAGYTILYACADGVGGNPYYGGIGLLEPDPTQTCTNGARLVRNSALPPAAIADAHPFIDAEDRFFNRYSNWINTLNLTWDVGDFTLSSQTSMWDYRHREYTNYDYTSYAVVVSKQGESGESWNQELRLQSNFNGRFNFMLGAFYEDMERDLDAPVQIFPETSMRNFANLLKSLGVPLPADPNFAFVPNAERGSRYFGSYLNYHQHWDNFVESFSLFGSIDLDITDQLELSGGLRYTEEDRNSVGGNLYEATGGFFFSPPGVIYTPADKSDNLSPEVTLSWHPTDDVLLYAAYKTGFQSAGISNPGTVPNLTGLSLQEQSDTLVFDETTVKGFEVGLKGYFLDGRLSGDLTVFRYRSEDLQVGIFNSNTTTFTLQNAAVAFNTGVEVQGIYQVDENLQLRLAGQYNKLKFDEWEDAGCHPVDGALGAAILSTREPPGCHIGPQGAPIQDLSGVSYGGPPLQVNIGATYSMALNGGWGLDLTWDSIYHNKGKRVLNQPFTEIPSRTVTHFSATLYQQDGPWEAGLICSNCFNEIYVTSIGNKPLAKINPGVNGDLNAQIAPPRLVTMQVTYRM